MFWWLVHRGSCRAWFLAAVCSMRRSRVVPAESGRDSGTEMVGASESSHFQLGRSSKDRKSAMPFDDSKQRLAGSVPNLEKNQTHNTFIGTRDFTIDHETTVRCWDVNPYEQFSMEWMIFEYHQVLESLRANTAYCSILGLTTVPMLVCQKELEAVGFEGAQETLRIAILCINVLLIHGTWKYYSLVHRIDGLNALFLIGTPFWKTRKIFGFLVEVLICVMCDPPFIDYTLSNALEEREKYSADQIQSGDHKIKNAFSLLIFLRIYLLFRFISMRFFPAGLKIVGGWFDFEFDYQFTMRNLLAWYPFRVISCAFVYTTASLAYCLFYCEREANEPLSRYSANVYLVIITGYTVGFGDTFPVTIAGRGVALVSVLMYAMINAVMVASVVRALALRPFEIKMVEFIHESKLRRSIRDSAAGVIQWFFRLVVARKREQTCRNRAYTSICEIRFINALNKFRLLRHQLKHQDKDMNQASATRRAMDRLLRVSDQTYNRLSMMRDGLFKNIEQRRSQRPVRLARASTNHQKSRSMPRAVLRMASFLKRNTSVSGSRGSPIRRGSVFSQSASSSLRRRPEPAMSRSVPGGMPLSPASGVEPGPEQRGRKNSESSNEDTEHPFTVPPRRTPDRVRRPSALSLANTVLSESPQQSPKLSSASPPAFRRARSLDLKGGPSAMNTSVDTEIVSGAIRDLQDALESRLDSVYSILSTIGTRVNTVEARQRDIIGDDRKSRASARDGQRDGITQAEPQRAKGGSRAAPAKPRAST